MGCASFSYPKIEDLDGLCLVVRRASATIQELFQDLRISVVMLYAFSERKRIAEESNAKDVVRSELVDLPVS